MAKKPRRKSYDPTRQLRRHSHTSAAHYMFAAVRGRNAEFLRRDGTQVRIPNARADRLLDNSLYRPHKWCVYLAVMFRDQQGRDNVRSEEYWIKDYIVLNELNAAVKDAHEVLVESVNPKHFLNVGWIACPDELHMSDAFACSIFERYFDAWVGKAPWEEETDHA